MMGGRGELKLTGSLGDVMRESAEAARSWLRSPRPGGRLGLDRRSFFETRDISMCTFPAGPCPRTAPRRGSGW